MKKITKNIILASLSVIASAFTAAIVSDKITKMMVNMALDRVPPKSIKKKSISMGESRGENPDYLIAKMDALKNRNTQTIKITASDGAVLVGHLFRSPNEKRIIIAVHGWRSSWLKDFSAISDFWIDNECTVLYVEQRGQGESGGEYMGFGMIERFDCLEWIKYIDGLNVQNHPIYLAGISMGASTVLMTSGFDLPQNVRGIIADAGFTSARDIWKHVADNMHFLYTLHSKQIEYICQKKINVSPDGFTVAKALETNSVPILFIHGADDKFVPVEMTYQNYIACKAPKRLLIVPGAGHGMSYIEDKDAYEREVKLFWEENDVSKK